ncbi:MAG TPA: winged helix-turn-helix domain-containing protein [Thermoanaerobaculia bacterium]|jgi:TolB-like protein|nr:winged helix-turn-helix domain-containing protein [Thermoanaerobaculia bacterium]
MFRFGDFELDLGRYELRRGAEVVKTEPRVLEVLNFLIEHRARVVPKEELLDTIWRDVHVSESALTTAIRDARRALGDSSGDPRWIRTVYGRGFRFVGEIIRVALAPSSTKSHPSLHPVGSTPPISTRKSIAVLPFTDLSPLHDQGHFCDGMAEELINTLTRIHELRVISRSLAFDFRSDDDLRALGEKLGVDHVLRGSVRKDGERLRISVHLVDVHNGHHVWSEKYDRQAGDVFALQEEIAESTTRVLLGVLTDRIRNAIKSTPIRVDAYEFYLKGHTYFGEKTPESLESAVAMFETAIELDHEYALAYAGLADALVDLFAHTREETLLQRADNASRRAIDLAPQLAETHLARGHVLSLAKRYREAGAELAVALSISPDASEAAQRLKEIELS